MFPQNHWMFPQNLRAPQILCTQNLIETEFPQNLCSVHRMQNLWTIEIGPWIAFNKAFAWLPFTALVGGRVLCMHGGISDRLRSLDQLRSLRRPVPDFDAANPTIELDLLWADPENGVQGCVRSPRGASVMFGEDVVARICKQLDIDLVVRAHQVVQDGAEFFANRKLITLFSAPHYAAQYNNAGATMFIDENLRCSFQVFQPAG
ncbi:unnamed protein product [Meloidogyne enterolobii]|uniref:Uncharacterized protein n=1 Tax=Meloidogyne enterolobii TaxID=390850 RepID=A0ACB0XNX1_MELEN